MNEATEAGFVDLGDGAFILANRIITVETDSTPTINGTARSAITYMSANNAKVNALSQRPVYDIIRQIADIKHHTHIMTGGDDE